MGIYVIQLQGLPFLKIGKAISLKARLASFETGSPVPIIVVAWWHPLDDGEAEWEAHCQWAGIRVKGEWFKDTPELRAWAESKGIGEEKGKPHVGNRNGKRKASFQAESKKRKNWLSKHPNGLVSPRDFVIPSLPSSIIAS